MSVSLRKPTHRATNAIVDGRTRAYCECMSNICPVHSAATYADSMALHAAAYDGSYSGYGSTLDNRVAIFDGDL